MNIKHEVDYDYFSNSRMLLNNCSNPMQDVRAAERRPGGSFEILQALKILY